MNIKGGHLLLVVVDGVIVVVVLVVVVDVVVEVVVDVLDVNVPPWSTTLTNFNDDTAPIAPRMMPALIFLPTFFFFFLNL